MIQRTFGSSSKANEAFVSENYSAAVDLYTAALDLDPQFCDALVARAHANIKGERYKEAKKDADRAIDILRSQVILKKSFNV